MKQDENSGATKIGAEEARLEARKLFVKRFIISFVLCAIGAVLVLVSKGTFTEDKASQELIRDLSDAFFVPGALALGLGLLLWVSQEGGLDFLAFSGQFVVRKLFFKRNIGSYYDFKMERHGKAKASVAFLLICGLIYVAAAAVFTMMFMSKY